MENKLVDSVEALMEKIEQVRKAQEKFATYTQEQVDKIFRAAALAANNHLHPFFDDLVDSCGQIPAMEMDSSTAKGFDHHSFVTHLPQGFK